MIKVFKDHGLQLAIESGLIQTDFLDITFHITSGRYWPYRKPNDKPLYINATSNHTPVIKKQLPSMLPKRLSDLSCNQEEFVKASSAYSEALWKSGYQDEILYQNHTTHTRNRVPTHLSTKNSLLFPYLNLLKTNSALVI